MNIDEARERLKEHDALMGFVEAMKTASPETAAVSFSFEVARALLPVALWRCHELALAFDGQKTPEPEPSRPTTPGRPKVKPAVVEAFRETKDDSEAAWKKWAEVAGFKWGSVANVLRELRAEQLRAERDARLKAERHDNDLRKDASADLPSGVFHTK